MSNKDYPEVVNINGTEQRYRHILGIKCMYCKRMAFIIQFENGNGGVTHEEPYCPEFGALDPLVFIQNNRKWIEDDIAAGNTKEN